MSLQLSLGIEIITDFSEEKIILEYKHILSRDFSVLFTDIFQALKAMSCTCTQ